MLAAYTWWTAGMLALAFIDAAVLRLPHRLTLTTTVGTVILLIPADADTCAWWTATIAATGLAGSYALIHLTSRAALGLGDVAVSIPIAIAVGWLDWHLVAAAALLGHTMAVAAIAIRRATCHTRAPLPLGTYLIIAAFTVAVTGMR